MQWVRAGVSTQKLGVPGDTCKRLAGTWPVYPQADVWSLSVSSTNKDSIQKVKTPSWENVKIAQLSTPKSGNARSKVSNGNVTLIPCVYTFTVQTLIIQRKT